MIDPILFHIESTIFHRKLKKIQKRYGINRQQLYIILAAYRNEDKKYKQGRDERLLAKAINFINLKNWLAQCIREGYLIPTDKKTIWILSDNASYICEELYRML